MNKFSTLAYMIKRSGFLMNAKGVGSYIDDTLLAIKHHKFYKEQVFNKTKQLLSLKHKVPLSNKEADTLIKQYVAKGNVPAFMRDYIKHDIKYKDALSSYSKANPLIKGQLSTATKLQGYPSLAKASQYNYFI